MMTYKQKEIVQLYSKLMFLGLSKPETYRVAKRTIEKSLDFRSTIQNSKFACRKVCEDIVYYGPNGYAVLDAKTKQPIIRRKYGPKTNFGLAIGLHSRYDYASLNGLDSIDLSS